MHKACSSTCLILLLRLVLGNELFAQEIAYPYRATIQKLSSAKMLGRGYYKHGDGIAAKFLVNELKRLNTEPAFIDDKSQKSYCQPFNMPVHYFIGSEVKVNGKKLKTGVQYLPFANCPKTKKTFHTFLEIDSLIAQNQNLVDSTINKSKEPPFLIFRFKKAERLVSKLVLNHKPKPQNQSFTEIAGIIVVKESFTHDLEPEPAKIPHLFMQDSVIDKLRETNAELRLDIDTQTEYYYNTANVGAFLQGHNNDSLLIIGAHYDHLGMVGDALFSGANDNASGTTMLLALANYYSRHPEKRPCNMLFLWFAGEEAGLIGSKYYTEHPSFTFKMPTSMINLDLLAGGSEGIMLVNGKENTKIASRFNTANDSLKAIPKVALRPNAPNSDHYWFAKKGVPAVFMYTMGDVKAYHDVFDTAESLKLAHFESVFKLLVAVINHKN